MSVSYTFEGIDAVGIQRLAQHFGVTPMALYWHVKNKDELLAAMGDQVLSRLELPSPDSLPWDQHYRLLLTTLLEALRAIPARYHWSVCACFTAKPDET